MATSIPAIVTPEVLEWARSLDRVDISEIATKMKIPPDRIIAWEKGTEKPTLSQARDLAKRYRVPFAYFYLPCKPTRTKRLEKVDFRMFTKLEDRLSMTRELRWFLRDIEDRRDVMIQLYQISRKTPHHFDAKIDEATSVNEFASTLRAMLNLTRDIQVKFRKPEIALSHCITELEKRDFLVFQAAKIAPAEIRGLSLAYDEFPIIAINRKDAPAARLFTLCHELVHILKRTSGICNETYESGDGSKIEQFCNSVAGCTLVPDADLKRHPLTHAIVSYGFDDSIISALSRDFAVSREVIIYRLYANDAITRNEYQNALERYTKEYNEFSKSRATDGGFLPPAIDKGTQVGKLYARTVLSAYYAEKISPRDASGYLLNLHLQHFRRIEGWCYKS